MIALFFGKFFVCMFSWLLIFGIISVIINLFSYIKKIIKDADSCDIILMSSKPNVIDSNTFPKFPSKQAYAIADGKLYYMRKDSDKEIDSIIEIKPLDKKGTPKNWTSNILEACLNINKSRPLAKIEQRRIKLITGHSKSISTLTYCGDSGYTCGHTPQSSNTKSMFEERSNRYDDYGHNPASGLSMTSQSHDVAGNAYGTSSSSSINSSTGMPKSYDT